MNIYFEGLKMKLVSLLLVRIETIFIFTFSVTGFLESEVVLWSREKIRQIYVSLFVASFFVFSFQFMILHWQIAPEDWIGLPNRYPE